MYTNQLFDSECLGFKFGKKNIMIFKKSVQFAIVFILLSSHSLCQLGNLKGKVKPPNTSISNNNSNNNKPSTLKGSDKSGLFSKIDPNGSVASHCRTAVEDLNKLDEFYASNKIDYEALQKLMDHLNRTLANIRKLEPEVDETKFQERFSSLEERALNDFSALKRIKEIDKILREDFLTESEFPKPNPLNYRLEEDICYCRRKAENNRPLNEYLDLRNEYFKLEKQLVGYHDKYELAIIGKIDSCVSNAFNYLEWVCHENFEKEIIDFNAKRKESNPKSVIKKCEEYKLFFERFITDYSIQIDQKAETLINETTLKINAIQQESEEYISSGKYQIYLDKMHTEKIASVFVPKAEYSNSTLEAGVKKWVMGAKDHFNGFAIGDKIEGIKSVNRTSISTPSPIVEKNNDGTIKWKYYSIWTAFTTTDNKCYLVRVFATYNYEGGGKYSSTPVYGSEYLDEMSCDNVNK